MNAIGRTPIHGLPLLTMNLWKEPFENRLPRRIRRAHRHIHADAGRVIDPAHAPFHHRVPSLNGLSQLGGQSVSIERVAVIRTHGQHEKQIGLDGHRVDWRIGVGGVDLAAEDLVWVLRFHAPRDFVVEGEHARSLRPLVVHPVARPAAEFIQCRAFLALAPATAVGWGDGPHLLAGMLWSSLP